MMDDNQWIAALSRLLHDVPASDLLLVTGCPLHARAGFTGPPTGGALICAAGRDTPCGFRLDLPEAERQLATAFALPTTAICRHCGDPLSRIDAGWVDEAGFTGCVKATPIGGASGDFLPHEPMPAGLRGAPR